MPRRVADDQWDNDEWDDEDFDDDDADEATVACPFCRRQIHEDADVCPYCRNFVSAADAAATLPRKPWWFIVGFLMALYAVYHWIVG